MIKKLLVAISVIALTHSICLADSNVTVLNKINKPADVKNLSLDEMNALANDIRYGIINKVDKVGGHLGPDLGFVEPTIALHYVFDAPKDRIIFDVSHQIYPHKMLTGRKRAFLDPLNNTDISGYSNQDESKYDYFKVGHTSTSLSLASGVAKARDLKGEKYNVVAIIGDGSLSGGEALEGLSNAAVLNSNIIIVVNDNEMAIAENHGGLYTALAELRKTNGQSQNNIFKAMGFDYYYLEDGNNTEELINLFKRVKNTAKPTVVHIHTLKGKGYELAEQQKEKYHWQMPNFIEKDKNNVVEIPETYNLITSNYLLNKVKQDKNIVVVSPATPSATGLTPDVRNQLGKNYVDVGIAEQYSVGFISGVASNGAKPILEVMSSFIQRSYDQLSQDLALNNNPATILVFGGGISSADMTHLGIFDIPLISNIPNIVYLSPVYQEEYMNMLDFALKNTKYPVAIRVPRNIIKQNKKDTTDYSRLNKYKLMEKGGTVAIIGAGNFYPLAQQVKQELKEKTGIEATLINPIYLSGIDKDMLENLKKEHKVVITLEDGCLDGGYGEKITRFYGDSNMKVLNYGASKEFTDRVPLKELYNQFRLNKEQIVEDIMNILNK